MSVSVSASGIQIAFTVPVIFPTGFVVSQFSDDVDPLDFSEINIGDSAMNINGELAVWTVPSPIPLTVSVRPGSEGDDNLSILFNANRISVNKIVLNSNITATVTYPDNSSIRLSGGIPVSFTPGKGVGTAGRLKTKTYTFNFENIIETFA